MSTTPLSFANKSQLINEVKTVWAKLKQSQAENIRMQLQNESVSIGRDVKVSLYFMQCLYKLDCIGTKKFLHYQYIVF